MLVIGSGQIVAIDGLEVLLDFIAVGAYELGFIPIVLIDALDHDSLALDFHNLLDIAKANGVSAGRAARVVAGCDVVRGFASVQAAVALFDRGLLPSGLAVKTDIALRLVSDRVVLLPLVELGEVEFAEVCDVLAKAPG